MTENVNRPSTQPRPRMRAALAAVASASLVMLGTAVPLSATAAPAPDAPTNSYTAVGAFSGTVPDGVCAVETIATGGAGGRSAGGGGGVGANGAGARVTATFSVLPGQAFAGIVGGGGKQNSGRNGGAGGAGGGGVGGTAVTDHGGAGGGGRSSITLDGADLVVAGGGGGSGGGHSTTSDGFGGNAGLPTASGVFSGADGTAGKDADASIVAGGGQGGQTGAPGAGGVNSSSSSLNGLAGSGTNGGAGGADPNYDAGGGGGAGYLGGGGGASTTIREGDDGVTGVAGGGGGGGTSYVDADARPGSVASSAIGRQTGTGAGADGSVSLNWIECDYDLAVVKSFVIDTPASGTTNLAPVGSTVTWTVSVTNNGPDAMTRGDLLTLSDGVPGGPTEITAIGVTGGGNTELVSGAFTCDAAVGGAMPTELECSRAYQRIGSPASSTRGLDVGETFTVSYEQTVRAADIGSLSNTAAVTDRNPDDDDDSSTAIVTVVSAPSADDDFDLGNTIGDTVTVTVLANDDVDSTPATVQLLVGSTPTTSIEVPGEGTWTVVGNTVVFTPEDGFLTDPTPVTYRVTDANGLTASASVTVTYLPGAADDEDLDNTLGTEVTVDVLGNDTGEWDASSVVLVDPASGGARVTELTVTGEGRWSVDAVTGEVTFTPEDGFLGDPTPVQYEVTDVTGDTVGATVTVTYVPTADDDEDLGNEIGTEVSVDVLGNDAGDWDATTVVLIDPATDARVTELTIAGQGVWTVDETTGAVTFAPEEGFEGSPAPIDYEATDTTGDTVRATITVTYAPAASDDADHGNTLGDAVPVDVLANDSGELDPTTVKLIGDGGVRVTELTVEGEGVWTVDPTTGVVTFTPADGFTGNPTPVEYEVEDVIGQTTVAEIVVTYLPESSDDISTGNRPGTAVTVDILGNDYGVFDPSTARLVDPKTGDRVTTLTVAGQGTWTVDPTTGAVTFTPAAGFTGDPTPVEYEVEDLNGNLTSSLVVIRYLPPALASSGADLTPLAGGLAMLVVGLTLLGLRRRLAR